MAIVTSPKLLINKFVKERKNPKAADKQESKKKGTDAIRSVPITTGEHRQLQSRTLEANLLGEEGQISSKKPFLLLISAQFSRNIRRNQHNPERKEKIIARLDAAKSAKFREGEGNKNKKLRFMSRGNWLPDPATVALLGGHIPQEPPRARLQQQIWRLILAQP
jgi:hypothetical protein